MQAKSKNTVRIICCVMLVGALAAVRIFESDLFYDPFSAYFTNDYLNLPFPAFDFWPLIASIGFRYALNTILSLAIIFVLFSDIRLIKFTAVLYLAFFIALCCAFSMLILFSDERSNFALFYIRRFLIQPLFLLLFVPAFYYQTRLAKK